MTDNSTGDGAALAVGVLGAYGAMGSLACAAIRDAEDLELGAAIGRDDDRQPLADCDVAVDLTHPGAVLDNLQWCVAHGLPTVVGTSGFTEERLDEVRRMLVDQPGLGVIVVPNFSIGAVLMMRFAEAAAPFFESVEIVEMHHPGKRDAPSGTALRTAQLVAQARRTAGRDGAADAPPTEDRSARGTDFDGVPVHSLRVRGAVAHQENVLGNAGETLTIRHDMFDRVATVPGMLACIRRVTTLPGLTIGLDDVMAIT